MVLNKQALLADCNEYLRIYASTVADEAAKELCNAAKQAIDSFYGAYHPSIYDRENNIRRNSYRPYKKNNGRIYYGGVEISSEDMFEYSTGVWSTDKIARFVWTEGMHGKPYIMSFPPLSMLEMHFGMESNNIMNRAGAKGHQVAQSKGNYSVLNF